MEAAEKLACIHEDKKRTNEILERRRTGFHLRVAEPELPELTLAQKVRREVGALALPSISVIVAVLWAASR